MNFKKLVCLTIAFALAFAPVVGAQEETCTSCKTPQNVLVYAEDQGGCEPISFERQTYSGTKRWGYTTGSQFDAKLIIRVCSCPSVNTYFKQDSIIGLRLTILTDGVYWSNENVVIQPFRTESEACAAGVGFPGVGTVAQNDGVGPAATLVAGTPDNPGELTSQTALPNVRYNAQGVIQNPKDDKVFLPPMAVIPGGVVPSEGYDQPYSWNYNPGTRSWAGTAQPDFRPAAGFPKRVNNTDLVEYFYWRDTPADWKEDDDGPPSRAIAGLQDPDCGVVKTKRQVLQINRAYQIGYLDEEYKLCFYWVDLPQMLKQIDEIKPNDELVVRVELLYDPAQGICAEPRTICSCDYTLGIFGDDIRTVYFPYVFTGINPWVTGIVVSNLDTVTTPVSGMTANFTLYDSTGKKFTYSKSDFQASVWPFMLDSIVDKFDGTPKAGAGWLRIDTNFKVDGYQFVTDGVYGAGTLPRVPGFTSGRLD